MNNCCGNCNEEEDKSKAMYSIDYDGLIEKLEETRDELDSAIKILKNRKEKDSIINTILSKEYEDEEKSSIEEEPSADELLDYLIKIQKQRIPYKYYYYDDKDTFRYRPWFTF